MKIAVIGTGYVGLVTGACFAEMGVDVTCIDVNEKKIEGLNNGIIPIYEPGLEIIVKKNVAAGRLKFTTVLEEGIKEATVAFCAVGTPPQEDGSADLTHVMNVARNVGSIIENYILFVIKSTVPVGTVHKAQSVLKAELDKRGSDVEFDVASNPEFLKEGAAVNDFMSPDRVVVGVENQRARDIMTTLYKPFMLNKFRIIFTDILSAEMIKYASNAMLATRISFMNDIANLCDKVGADVNLVRLGVGSDSRIGSQFLYAGIGYGGSCFPKDVRALISTAEQNGYSLKVLKAVEEVNNAQKSIMFSKIENYFKGDLKGKKIAVWGIAFKPETDDIREAPSLVMISLLKQAGAEVSVYDPVAMEEAGKTLKDGVKYSESLYDAAKDVDGILIVTEWKEFRMPDWKEIKRIMRGNVIFDGRNIFEPSVMEGLGFEYYSIGRPRKQC